MNKGENQGSVQARSGDRCSLRLNCLGWQATPVKSSRRAVDDDDDGKEELWSDCRGGGGKKAASLSRE